MSPTFTASCGCGLSYLIYTEADGARCQAIGEVEDIREQFDTLPGRELHAQLSGLTFRYKTEVRSI